MATNKYHNLNQIINQFSDLTSADIFTNTEFDLQYNKSDYSTSLGRYVTGDVVNVNNRQIIGDSYIEDNLNDFVDYWKSIENILSGKNLTTEQMNLYYQIKSNYIQIVKDFSIWKGTSDYIKFIYNLYSNLTTTDFWLNDFVLIEKCNIFSNFKNLEYNLSGNLSSYVWETIIKPTVHPAGWICNYRGIDFNEDYTIISYDDHLKNNYNYIDYVGCNDVINNNMATDKYYFDYLNIYMYNLLSDKKVNFQFDSYEINII